MGPDTPVPIETLLQALSRTSDAVVVTDADLDPPGPTILYVNAAFEQMTGYRADDVIGSSPRQFQGQDSDRSVLDTVRADLTAGKSTSASFINYRKDGSPYTVRFRIDPISGPDGRTKYYVSTQTDVTTDQQLRHRVRNLELLNEFHRQIVAEGLSLDSVRERVVEWALEATNADAAVVEEVDGPDMVYRAVTGTAADQLGLRIPIDRSLSGYCYRTRKTVVCEDTDKDDRVKMKEAARSIGFRSAVMAPLVHEDRCFGAVKVYSDKPSYFRSVDKELLQRASGILAASLMNAAAFDDEVKRRHLLVDSVPILISFIDRDGRFREVNAAYEKLLELPASQIQGSHVSEIFEQEDYDAIRPYMDAALRGESVTFEVTMRGNGAQSPELIVRGQFTPHQDVHGDVDGIYGSLQDVTNDKYAEVDYLTGILNRRKFEEQGRYLMDTRARYDRSISLLMVDIDHFKIVNDSHGHAVGDEVLKEFSGLLAGSVRAVDLLCRWGGEEFAVLVYDAGLEAAKQFADRIAGAIRSHEFPQVGRVTASIGVATGRADEKLPDVQKRADEALYQAKNDGRDCVRVSD